MNSLTPFIHHALPDRPGPSSAPEANCSRCSPPLGKQPDPTQPPGDPSAPGTQLPPPEMPGNPPHPVPGSAPQAGVPMTDGTPAACRQKNAQEFLAGKVPSYSVEDLFPYGHGEKSVFLIERFMKLKVEEAVAIRWHMGGFDDAVRGGSFALSGAFEKYPLAVKLHIADLEATYLLEQRGE